MAELPFGTVASISELRIVTFFNKDGDKVGELDFSAEKIIFEGNAGDSANSFFALLKDVINPFLKE